MKHSLRRIAYREAAALLESDMDRADLPEYLSEGEEEEVREFIRTKIVGALQAKGAERACPSCVHYRPEAGKCWDLGIHVQPTDLCNAWKRVRPSPRGTGTEGGK